MDDDPFAWTTESRLTRLEMSLSRIESLAVEAARYAQSAKRWWFGCVGLWVLSMAALAIATLSVLNVD